ncbi:DUF1206 domain-containing protein [Polaribacter sp. Hel_I_88]|uniref:DUF1206 domain-containing protein n=1 Tax=Polaribacter sp. Hel_I_88 TaxID=1250006 RepID=UPI000479255C|nr:DUF1206 domain-containing protein [Polaribacter sp. Hel_I_88]
MIQKIRTIGFYTKGFLYILLGILTFLAALNLGGKVANKNGVIKFLEDQIFGKILLIIIGLGILAYAIWRFFKAYKVLKKEDNNKKYFLSIDFFTRGIIYGSFGVSILYKVFNIASKDVSKETIASNVLKLENGQYILYAMAIIVFFSALNQFYIVYKKNYLNNIKKSENIESFSFLKKSGKFGITSRGVSFLIFAWFIYKAASTKNPDKIKGTQEMFRYLHSLSFGDILMAVMALGFISYGIFQYFYARYSTY